MTSEVPHHPCRLHVSGDDLDLGLVPVGLPQVVDRDFVHGEEPDGGAVLRAHVGDRGAVGNGEGCHPGTEELHKFSHHSEL